jgi:hypothetical protein
MTSDRRADAPTASLRRRLRLADAWRYRLDCLLTALGRRRNVWLSDAPSVLGRIALDSMELVRTGGRPPHWGQPHLAALEAPVRVPQDPRYRGYWYDAGSHSLVGMQLGLDLIPHRDTYLFIESNVSARLNPVRRQLYDSDLDPLISELVGLAEVLGFEQIVLLKDYWTKPQVEEFGRATRETGVKVVGANIAAMDTQGHPPVNPMVALPERLRPRTMYVMCSSANRTPLQHFMHNKTCAARWLAASMAESGSPTTRLACIPTSDRLVVPAEPPGGRWPNLVVKLGNEDEGQAVAMGRFTTEEEARRGLRLDAAPGSTPGIFRRTLPRRLLDGLLGGRTDVLFQPFIPPDVVDGRAQKIRLHVFVSPLADAFLSAHRVLATADLPDHLPLGLVEDVRPFMVNISGGGRFCRLETEREHELREVAHEFGRLAKLAIERRFETRAEPEPPG